MKLAMSLLTQERGLKRFAFCRATGDQRQLLREEALLSKLINRKLSHVIERSDRLFRGCTSGLSTLRVSIILLESLYFLGSISIYWERHLFSG